MVWLFPLSDLGHWLLLFCRWEAYWLTNIKVRRVMDANRRGFTLFSYKNFFKGPVAICTLCALLSLTLGTLNLLLIKFTPELWKQLNFLEGFVINTVVFGTLISFIFPSLRLIKK
ncbi:hypothetical protein CHH58_06750 [Terribacillus saccharophilus]|uniref:hypothetical protein n=1 Tax=Terribacillus saccharophilus TaxID=361277 RepID=UPI000BA57230|nr:hypothetical protein [Terribacillus saccharophilus]PAF37883.1 hypothetical protein CHH58_06750 [Terribacillus saccharophilus]